MRTHTKRRRRNRPGVQHLWGFDNGHLASAVPDAAHADRWELTILDGNGRPANLSLPTSERDVLAALKPTDVRRILRQVETRR